VLIALVALTGSVLFARWLRDAHASLVKLLTDAQLDMEDMMIKRRPRPTRIRRTIITLGRSAMVYATDVSFASACGRIEDVGVSGIACTP
jgi:hypothetical protein